MRRILTFPVALALLLLPTSLAREGDGTYARLGEAPTRHENPGARTARKSASDGTFSLATEAQRETAALLEALHSARPGVRDPEEKEPGGALPTPASPRRLALLEASGVLRPGLTTRAVAGVRHTPYQLYKRGLPVLNRRGRLHEGTEGPLAPTGRFDLPGAATGGWVLTRPEAIALAKELTEVELLRDLPRTEPGWLAMQESTVPAWRVTLPSQRPFASWQVTLDARDGKPLSVVDLVRTATGVGDVYDPNPKQAANLSRVELADLDDSGHLSGSFVRVYDFEAPSAFDPGLRFVYPPEDPRFVQTDLYWGLTRAAQLALSSVRRLVRGSDAGWRRLGLREPLGRGRSTDLHSWQRTRPAKPGPEGPARDGRRGVSLLLCGGRRCAPPRDAHAPSFPEVQSRFRCTVRSWSTQRRRCLRSVHGASSVQRGREAPLQSRQDYEGAGPDPRDQADRVRVA